MLATGRRISLPLLGAGAPPRRHRDGQHHQELDEGRAETRRTRPASTTTSNPAIRTVPDVGRSSVVRIRMVVVLPAPVE